jgi:hypothetical protein
MASDDLPQHQRSLFPLGKTVATPAALSLLAWFEVSYARLLDRHVSGDWGVVDGDDAHENELALQEGFRLLSSYIVCDCATKNCDEHRVWVITEADRSATTILLPGQLLIESTRPAKIRSSDPHLTSVWTAYTAPPLMALFDPVVDRARS